MCNLTKHVDDKEIKGYKLVAVNKRSGNYFSLAMGFMYRDELIPKVRIQKVIVGSGFADCILDKNQLLFRRDMIGRTAIYIDEGDAIKAITSHRRVTNSNSKFTVEVKKTVVSIDLMTGTYGGDWSSAVPIAAGRRIKFLD